MRASLLLLPALVLALPLENANKINWPGLGGSSSDSSSSKSLFGGWKSSGTSDVLAPTNPAPKAKPAVAKAEDVKTANVKPEEAKTSKPKAEAKPAKPKPEETEAEETEETEEAEEASSPAPAPKEAVKQPKKEPVKSQNVQTPAPEQKKSQFIGSGFQPGQSGEKKSWFGTLFGGRG